MIRFFREQKFLATLLVLSFLVILAGLIMIQYTNKKAAEAVITAQESAQVQTTIDTMNVIAGLAEQELQESASNEALVNPVGDVKPQESLDRVAALNGRVPEVGSDDWCEVMMVKDADAWTKEEEDIFAQRCL
ncbi:MAG: DUF3012 domain-containing protein [Cellvibrio sp.]|uniref:DUF3012 domain-containing protein n=1 Tax=Cellvibrio sp. TaxID=1965322 RepID=UPI00271E6933|nr:DUF3012 domain-containing protein [Cellvibrio sp.]